MGGPRHVVTVSLPIRHGEFQAQAFRCSSGFVYLALVKGEIGTGASMLTRLHSECLTGDALGSLRCDCGVQLRAALRIIAAEGRGVLVYATGQEGRGIGLINKLRAYVEQDGGADTVDSNLRLGFPADARRYDDSAAVLRSLGVRSVRLLTNNPAKAEGLAACGVDVDRMEPIPTAAHVRNLPYLRAKELRLGHFSTTGNALSDGALPVVDVSRLLGCVRPPSHRPYVVLKYAQTLDGRIATGNGDSKWISGEAERKVSHALRAACDAVLVGVGTVVRDDPQLTVRMVPGASPIRVVMDSSLRTPPTARVVAGDGSTVILTTERSHPDQRDALRSRRVGVLTVAEGPDGVDVRAGLQALWQAGIRSVLVEGGARIITSMLVGGVADRIVVGLAPTIIGTGTEAVGNLGVARVADGIRLTNRSVHTVDDDLLVAWDIARAGS